MNYLLFIFFLSGIYHLIFESLWTKMLVVVIGSSVYSSTITVSTFMAGFAMGSVYGGNRIGRLKQPVLLFSVIHFLIGIYAFLVPCLIKQVQNLYILLSGSVWSVPFLNCIRLLTSAMVLLFPSFLIGISYPAVFTSLKGLYPISKEKRAGALIAAAALGGAIGAFMTGFFLIPIFGLSGSNNGAAWFAVILAFFTFLFSKRVKSKCREVTEDDRPLYCIEQTEKLGLNNTILAVSFISGMTFMGYEVMWLRLFIPVMESTTYTFCLILTVFVAGSGIGNTIFAFLPVKGKRLLYLGAAIELIIGLFAICSPFFITRLFAMGRALYSASGQISFADTVFIKFAILSIFIMPPAVLFGFVLPLLISSYSTHCNTTKNFSTALSYNIAGSSIGTPFAGFLVLPLFGQTAGIIAFGLLNIFAGAILYLYLNGRIFIADKKRLPCFLFLFIILIFMLKKGSAYLVQKPAALEGEKIIYYHEGINGNIEVSKNRKGFTILRVDNKAHGGNEPWVVEDEARIAHLSMLMASDPKDILLIGLGTGITLNELSKHEFNRIDCIEIVGGLLDTFRYFINPSENFFQRKGINIYVEDGRNYILRTKKIYDLVILDLIHPESVNAGNLFSKEYYHSIKDILRRDGITVQWLPLYQLSLKEVKIIMKTFSTVFPYTSLWLGNENPDFPLAFLIGSAYPTNFNERFLRDRIYGSRLLQQFINKEGLYAVLDSFIMDSYAIRRYTEEVAINTDNLPVLEFLIPKGLINRPTYGWKNYNEMIRLSHGLYEQFKKD